MKYCNHCGRELLDEAVICPGCGCAVARSGTNEVDENSTGLNVLSFFFPIVGLILYIVYNEKLPTKAKGVGKWALIGFIINLAILNIIVLGGLL